MKSSVQGCQQSYCLIVSNYSQLVRFSKKVNHFVAVLPLEEFSWFAKKKSKIKNSANEGTAVIMITTPHIQMFFRSWGLVVLFIRSSI